MDMMFPQEIEVWYILPAVRKELAAALKRMGLPQTQIADKLGLTKAAISQYLSGKRAKDSGFGKDVKHMIEESAKRIAQGNPMVPEVNNISREIWKTDFICRMHKKHADVPLHCDWCMRNMEK